MLPSRYPRDEGLAFPRQVPPAFVYTKTGYNDHAPALHVGSSQSRQQPAQAWHFAVRVFADPMAVTRQDRIKNGEQRWQTIGAVGGFTLLLVAHTLWDDEAGIEVVRIISARRADRKERRIYENG